MDVREKLVELLKKNACPSPFMCDPACRYYGYGDCFPDRFADLLIAHGVTVQKFGHWVSLTDCSNAGVYCSVCHKKVYKEDYAWCNRKNKLRSNYCPHCGAKMIPQKGKDEK